VQAGPQTGAGEKENVGAKENVGVGVVVVML
jgi:hypothetical protein